MRRPTLIEFLILVACVGVLSAITAPGIIKQQKQRPSTLRYFVWNVEYRVIQDGKFITVAKEAYNLPPTLGSNYMQIGGDITIIPDSLHNVKITKTRRDQR